MTKQDKYEMFIKIQEYIETHEGKENIKKTVKEYIDKNFVDVATLVLGDKNIYMLPKEQEKLIKIHYE